MEPLARLVRAKLDALGWKYSGQQVLSATGLTRSYMNGLVNRTEPYRGSPSIQKMQQLAQIPGLDITEITAAVNASRGARTATIEDEPAMSATRRSLHTEIDKLPEDALPGVLQLVVNLSRNWRQD